MKRPDSGNLTGMRFRAELLFWLKKLMHRVMIRFGIPSLEFLRVKRKFGFAGVTGLNYF